MNSIDVQSASQGKLRENVHEISKKHAGLGQENYNVLMQEMEDCNVGQNPVIDGLPIDSDEIVETLVTCVYFLCHKLARHYSPIDSAACKTIILAKGSLNPFLSTPQNFMPANFSCYMVLQCRCHSTVQCRQSRLS